MTNRNELHQINIQGTITATSNKQSEDFITENPRKSAYIQVDNQSKEILFKNGFTEYTSKKDGENFFIIKLSENIDVWLEDGENFTISSTVEDNNFLTNEKVDIAIIKGFSKGNNFYRVFALGVNKEDVIELVEKSNPFN